MRYLLVVALFLVAGAALADITRTWLSSSALATRVTIDRLPDGGAAVESCGRALDNTGQPGLYMCAPLVELTGAQQTTALNVLNGPALTQYKNAAGL